MEYPEGKNIIFEGDQGDKFFIIREGEVKCTKNGKEVSDRLGRGDFFGELALLSSDKRAATVRRSPLRFLCVTRVPLRRGPAADAVFARGTGHFHQADDGALSRPRGVYPHARPSLGGDRCGCAG